MSASFRIRGWLLLLLCLLFPVSALADKPVYKLAIVPQYTPLFIFRNWRPLVEQIEKDTGIRLEINTYKTFNQFIKALQNGEPDFSYLSPYHLVLARKKQDYIPLLRDGDKRLVGIVVVPNESKLQEINELNGKTIAFPSPNAFAASLYMRAWLREKIGIDFTPNYVGTHGNVYRNVVHGFVSAGAGVNSTLASQPKPLQESLRVLYEIPGVASHPLAAHSRVPTKIREALVKGIYSLSQSERGRKLLSAIQIAKPVAADYAADYAFLEKLNLEKYRGIDK
ncbi:MAG: phosphate/phosphite/phosphonate ABC transporter substrate-binding protein [Sulfuriflexus sp.]|nr:phosphate/phosphite/phosphonate ABC transporter substrate-binding protein [Sulfuriflexus sp.]